MGPKGIAVLGCTERRLGSSCKQDNIVRQGMRVCLGGGWAYSGDCGKRRRHGKQQRTGEVGQDQTE